NKFQIHTEAKHHFEKEYAGFEPDVDIENEWSIGIAASYSLFEGSKKLQEYEKVKAEIESLEFSLAFSKQEIELSIRIASYELFFAEKNILLSRVASSNALKSLELVEERYARGLVPISDLLDAQNESFIQESQAAIAVYSYLLRLATLFRTVSNFDLVLLPEYADSLLYEFEIYLQKQGADILE
ncbi:TolC family protein, partial [Chlamydiota bacterium]